MRTLTLTDGLSLRAPIVQAALGSCGSPRLAAAVSNAGGLGTLCLHAPRPDEARRLVARLKAITRAPVLIAFTAEWERPDALDACFEAGFRHFHVFWWNGPRLIRPIQERGGRAFWQVGTVGQADEALSEGADGLIVQGTEAGGQVRSPQPLRELLPAVRALAGASVPLIAGGGLADASDTAAVLALGADAALFGTRFLLSHEASAPHRDRARLLRAGAADLTLDTRLLGSWPCAPRRRLVTAFDDDRVSLFAGLGVERMRALLPAAELVRRLTPPRETFHAQL